MNVPENDCKQEYNIEEIGLNRYKTTFHVSSLFYGRIIGKKAATKIRIESETNTDIQIPRMGLNDDIKIMGKTRESVALCRQRIESIVADCRQKQRPTHFFGVKVSNEEIGNNFVKFKEEIMRGETIPGLTENMFIKQEKLHITISMLFLMEDLDQVKTSNLLDKLVHEIIRPVIYKHKKITVKLCGLDIMNTDPSAVHVLYAKVESDIFQEVCNQMFNRVIDAGLARREFNRDWVKLHMTLINVKYATKHADSDDVEAKSNAKNQKFDARNILENYSDFEFGSFDVSAIHLATLGTIDDDGFYKCVTHVAF